MNKMFLSMPIIFITLLAIEGFIPIWTVFIFIFPMLFMIFYESNHGFRGIETFIGLFVGVILVIGISPMLMSQVMNTKITNSTNPNSNATFGSFLTGSTSTTVWNNGIITLFITLLPLLIIVGRIYHFIGITREDYHYDDGTIRMGSRRTFRDYGYQYDWESEQSGFEKEIMDMDTIFKRDT